VLLAEARNAVEVELVAVAGGQLDEVVLTEVRLLLRGSELVEEMLEPSGHDDLEDPARLVAGAPGG
jgi:hypothetical protein